MSGLEGLLAGRTLVDRYAIEEVIGRGGFAAVYRATDQRLGRTVAVKVITLATSDPELRDQIRRRFHREARAAASLHHPNVVTVYDFGTDPELGLDFLVMELLHGEDLRARLRRGDPLPLNVAARVLRDAAWGVGAGHRVGLIHRDVKPGNVFLAEQERPQRFRVCVLDFGIAQIHTGEDSLTRLTRGPPPLSPSYASPEQLREELTLTPATDVFSLGVIGYEMLAGERPFGREEIAAMGRGRSIPVPALRTRNPEVPPELEAVIQRALAPQPDDRFPGARELADALDEVYTALRPPPAIPVAAPVAAPLPPPLAAAAPFPIPSSVQPLAVPPVAVPPPRHARRRVPAGALGALLLLAVGALAAWWALGRDGEPERRTAGSPAAAGEVRTEPAPTMVPPVESPAGPLAGPAAEREAAPGGAPESGGGAPRRAPAAESPPAAPETAARTAPSATAPVRTEPPAPVAAGGTGAEGLNREGELLFERGDVAGAVARFRSAVREAPGNAHYRNNLGWALFQTGEVEAAGRELAETLRLDPRRAIAHANLGEVHWARGDAAGAVAAYERFLELNDDPRRERIAREKLRRMRGAGATP